MTLHCNPPAPRICQLKGQQQSPSDPTPAQPWITMTGEETAPRPTPKRKRGDNGVDMAPIYTAAHFSFRLPEPKSDDDGSASPRTRVVHKLKGLNLDERAASSSGGGGVAADAQPAPLVEDRQSRSPPSLVAPQRPPGRDPTTGAQNAESSDEDADEGLTMRKRQKVPELEMRDVGVAAAFPTATTIPSPSVPAASNSSLGAEPQPEPRAITLKASFAPLSAETELQRSYPSINRLQDSKSRASRKRAGTPPLAKDRFRKQQDDSDDDGATEIVDPVRASLTWHENEITVYDPDDSDDDGTGVNGIGFKPTPALARIRTQKRKQQLLEYKKREDREARARRNRRRRGSTAEAAAAEAAQQAMAERRVRFTDAGAATVITTN